MELRKFRPGPWRVAVKGLIKVDAFGRKEDAFLVTLRAEVPSLAAKRQQKVFTAAGTPKAGETG
jgi:hypothetical protein